MKELIFIKLGGSLITDKNKPFTARYDVIDRLAMEIHEAREEKKMKLIVAHGGGSFPHIPANKFKVHNGVLGEQSHRGIAEVQSAAAKLNRIIVNSLLRAGENAISVQPSACMLSRNGQIVDFYMKPIKEMLEHNLIPVPYGDVSFDLKKGCAIISTEKILSFLAPKLKPKRIIVAGLTNGVFTSDPNLTADAELIQEITPSTFNKIKKHLKGSHGIDVTGGMLHKVETLVELARLGIESQILSGLKEGNLKVALLGNKEIGSRVRAG